jgi:hypothetical protein
MRDPKYDGMGVRAVTIRGDTRRAAEAPFPDERSKVGPRTFPPMVSRTPDAPGAAEGQAGGLCGAERTFGAEPLKGVPSRAYAALRLLGDGRPQQPRSCQTSG